MQAYDETRQQQIKQKGVLEVHLMMWKVLKNRKKNMNAVHKTQYNLSHFSPSLTPFIEQILIVQI